MEYLASKVWFRNTKSIGVAIMNKRNLIIGSIAALLLLTTAVYLLISEDDVDEQDTTVKLSTQTKREDIDAFNKALNEMQSRREKAVKNKTPEKKAKEKSFLNKLAAISKAAIMDIKFYGKIVDQNGDPVSDVTVEHVGLNAIYASGSGTRRAFTDENGLFIVDASGTAFVVEKFTKPGYEFPPRQRFVNERGQNKAELLWSDYTEDNPYVFKAWKVVKSGYPNVSEAKTNYGFKLGKTYSMDFTSLNKRKIRKEGKLDLDMQVLFNRDDAGNWSLKLSVPDGGLIETKDQYLNMAPESGYQQVIEYSGTKKDYVLEKNYYIHSRGRLYGRLNTEIQPFMKNGSALYIKHVLNLEGGRNLEVK